jgi:hypothetical protein
MGLASCEAPLKHLGISETPKKSTLAYANENRPWELYQTVFHRKRLSNRTLFMRRHQ